MFWLRQNVLPLFEDSPPRERSPDVESFCSALSEGGESFYSALSDQRSTHSVYYDAEPSELESSDSDSRYADADEEIGPEQVTAAPDDSDTTASANEVVDDEFESFSYGKIFEDVYGSVIHRPPPLKSRRKGDSTKRDFGNEPVENLPQRIPFSRGAYKASPTALMSGELPRQLSFPQTVQPSTFFEQDAVQKGNTEMLLLMSVLEEAADGFAEFIIDEALLEAPKKCCSRLWWKESNGSKCETSFKGDAGVERLSSRRYLEESQNGHWETFERDTFLAEEDFEKMSVEERDILDEFDKHFEPCLESEDEPDSHAFDDVSEEELESWGESERDEKGLLNKNALLGKFKRFPQSGRKKGVLNRGHSLSDGSREGSTPKCSPLPTVPATSSAGELTGNEWRRHSADILNKISKSGTCILNGKGAALDHEYSASSSVLSSESLAPEECVSNNLAMSTCFGAEPVERRALDVCSTSAMQARREGSEGFADANIEPVPVRPMRKHSHRKESTVPDLMLGKYRCSSTSKLESPLRSFQQDQLSGKLDCKKELHSTFGTSPTQFDRIATDRCALGKPKDVVKAPSRRAKSYIHMPCEATGSASSALSAKTLQPVLSPSVDQAANRKQQAASGEMSREQREVVADNIEEQHSTRDPQPVPNKRQFRGMKWTNEHDTTVCHEDLAMSSRKDLDIERPTPPRRHHRNTCEDIKDLTSPHEDRATSDEQWSEALDDPQVIHLPFSLSELTGRLFDDSVPLDVVSLKVVDNFDFLENSDDTSPPYVMKLDPGKDLSAFLVDPDVSEWSRADDVDCVTPEDVSRHASDASAGLDCVLPDGDSLLSAGQLYSETWTGSPLEAALQLQEEQKALRAAALSDRGAFHGPATCADQEQPSVTVHGLIREALSGKDAPSKTSCLSYQEILPPSSGTQTGSDCSGVSADASAVPAMSPLEEGRSAQTEVDRQNYVNVIKDAKDTDLIKCFEDTFVSRDVTSSPADNDQHNPLSGDGQSNHTTNLQRPHDPQRNTGNGSQQKKSSVAVRHNDRINASVDTRQKKCELKEGSGAALPLGHPGGTSRDVSDLQGREKGIQGHHNSCYLDATLFAMFSCTNVFDGMLNRPKKETPKERDIDAYSDIQAVLRDDIVNTLRRHKFVPHKNVMKLRELLDALGGVSGLTTEEKDPEEFLNSLFMALRVDPYLQLSSGQGTHLYQLFVEKHQLLDIPTVQQLFHHSIHDSNIKLKQIPPVLIIQMPRFGKQFKVYPCIIPSLKLDITDALENSPRSCFVCGRLACKECRDCFRPDVGLEGTSYCSPCSDAVHKHPDRQRHPLSNLKVNETIDKEQPVQRHYMDLCAVVCIETSHYVCFVKYGESDQSTWVFFDSMADREGGEDGHNIPEVVEFHDHKKWLSDAAMTELKEYPDKKLVPNMGRRLLCDAYMCMYKSNMASRYC